MMTRHWQDSVHEQDVQDQHIESQDEITGRELCRMTLREIRKVTGITQAELAERIEMTQGQLSATERREDHRLSTLRRIIEALGGKLEIVAVFGDKCILIEKEQTR